MRIAFRLRLPTTLSRFKRNDDGATAVEFGIVALPFLMLVFGVAGTGLHFFTTHALEHAVETASRQIRTGQAQTAGMNMTTFKNLVCSEGSSYIDCAKLQVHVQTGTNWAEITPRACLDGAGSLAGTPGQGTDTLSTYSGGASAVVLVTLCYEWELASKIPFLNLSSMPNGSALIQAATTFRTEPYQ